MVQPAKGVRSQRCVHQHVDAVYLGHPRNRDHPAAIAAHQEPTHSQLAIPGVTDALFSPSLEGAMASSAIMREEGAYKPGNDGDGGIAHDVLVGEVRQVGL